MVSLLMLQHALAPSIADAHARSRLPALPGSPTDDPASLPYLKVTGAVALRFAAPPPPPDLTSKPPAGAPPPASETVHPDVTPAISPAEAAKALPSDLTPITPAASKPVNLTPTILPDDTRAAPRAEDFLPFFQFPGSSSPDVTLAPRPPAPGQLPPSSATYQQK
jgi:hypothetical protein